MPGADPAAGAPISSSAVSADAGGRLVALVDVPDTGTAASVVRSVRLRPDPAPGPGAPAILAATSFRTAARSVSIERPSREAAAG